MKLEIALDFDGTLCNSLEVWIKCFHDYLNKNPVDNSSILATYDFYKDYHLSNAEFLDLVKKTYDNRDIKYAAPMDYNFPKWVKKLQAQGHHLYVLTANKSYSRDVIKYWLSKYGIDLDIYIVDDPEQKILYTWDMLVDDSPNMAVARCSRAIVVYNTSWNENIETNNYRANNFSDVYDIAQKIDYKLGLAFSEGIHDAN